MHTAMGFKHRVYFGRALGLVVNDLSGYRAHAGTPLVPLFVLILVTYM